MKQLVFLFLFLSTKSFAQTGYPDSTFNYERREKFGDGYGFNMSYVNDLDFLDNGKMLYTGSFSDYGGWIVNGLSRLNSDRSLDKTFQAGFNSGCWLRQSEVLSNQKIIVAGGFSSVGGQSINGIVRLNEDGTVDNSFLIGSGINSGGVVNSFLIDANNKIVLAGNFTSINGVSCHNIARLNSDGTVDLTFNTAIGADGTIYSLREFANGNYAIGGVFTTYYGVSRNKIAVVLPDGTADLAFDIQGGFSGEVYGIDIQQDQKILLVGFIYSFNSSIPLNNIARVNTNGSLDTTFSNYNLNSTPTWIEERTDGTILVAGAISYYDANGFIAKGLMVTNADGSVTQLVETNIFSSYYPNQFYVSKTVITPSNEIYVVGYVDYTGAFSPYSGVIKFNGSTYDYIPETSIGTGPNKPLDDGLVQHDGKIVCVGNFQSFDGIVTSGIVRLNQDGTIDTTFISGTGIQSITGNPEATALEQQLDDKLIVAGNFNNYNGTSLNGPIRLNADGTLDNTFNAGTGVNGQVYDMAIQPDGKIILAGHFNYYNGNYCSGLCRINVDGSYDPTFAIQPQLTSPAEVYSVEILENGQIVVGGYFDNRMIRLNNNGTLDASFAYTTAATYSVTEIELLDDGKLIVLTTGNGIKRVNTDGTFDNSFVVSGLPANNSLTSICLRPNGTIVTPNGILNSDGSFQNTNLFSNSTSWYNVNRIRLAYDGRIYFFTEHYTHPNLPMYNGIVCLIDTIPAVNGLEVYFDNIHEVTCSDSGSVHANAIFGQAPYTFEWLVNGSDNQYFVPGEPGFYGCAVIDNSGSRDTSYLYVDGPILLNEIDLRATLHSNEFRPGFEGTLWINASNEGCVITEGSLTLVVDTLLDSLSAVPAPTSISGDTLTWNYAAINSDSGPINILLDYYVPVYAQIGDSVSLEVKFLTNDSDVDLTNNIETHKIPIVNGYDPNYISAYPYGFCEELYVDSNQTMTYTIHFQNTGNSEAIHIKVLNELDGPLNLSSLKLLGSSSPVWVELIDDSTLMFHFDNIHLIDSIHNEPNSHGFVTYSMRSVYNSFGTIGNNAQIFFDYNPPVVTNTVTNTVYNSTVSPETCFLSLNEYTETATACDSYTWNGNTYTTSGVYTAVFANSVGYDSVVTLNLTILESTESSELISACDSYTWNGNTYTASGTYNVLFDNVAGCDSIATLVLTIHESDTIISTVSSCGSYTWNNGVTYTVSGTYIDTLQNSYGCDSVLFLQLTIPAIPTVSTSDNGDGSITASVCDTYEWIDCATNNSIVGATDSVYWPTENGDYAVIGTTNGCSDTSECVTIDSLDLKNEFEGKPIVYPNPFRDELTITSNIPVSVIRINDVSGKQLLIKDIHSGEVINLSGLIPGTYHLSVVTERGVFNYLVVKD